MNELIAQNNKRKMITEWKIDLKSKYNEIFEAKKFNFRA